MFVKCLSVLLIISLVQEISSNYHHNKKYSDRSKHENVNSNLEKSYHIQTRNNPHRASGVKDANKANAHGSHHKEPTGRDDKTHSFKKRRSVSKEDLLGRQNKKNCNVYSATTDLPLDFQSLFKSSNLKNERKYVSFRDIEAKEFAKIHEGLMKMFDFYSWRRSVERSLEKTSNIRQPQQNVPRFSEHLSDNHWNSDFGRKVIKPKRDETYRTYKPFLYTFNFKSQYEFTTTTSKPFSINWNKPLSAHSFPTFPAIMTTESYSEEIKDITPFREDSKQHKVSDRSYHRNHRVKHNYERFHSYHRKLHTSPHRGVQFSHHKMNGVKSIFPESKVKDGKNVFSDDSLPSATVDWNSKNSSDLIDENSNQTHSHNIVLPPYENYTTSAETVKNVSQHEQIIQNANASPGKNNGTFEESVYFPQEDKQQNRTNRTSLCKDGGSVQIPLLDISIPCGNLGSGAGSVDDYYKREFATGMSDIFYDYIEKQKENNQNDIDIRLGKTKRSADSSDIDTNHDKNKRQSFIENKVIRKNLDDSKELDGSVFGEIMDVPKDLTKNDSIEYFDISMLSDYFLEAVDSLDETSLIDVLKALKEDYLSKSPNDQDVVDQVYEKLVSSLLDYKRADDSWTDRRRRESPSKTKAGAAAVLELLAETDKHLESEMHDDPFANDYYGEYSDKDQGTGSSDNPSFLELVSLADKHKSKS